MRVVQLLTLFVLTAIAASPARGAECVIFLHGLARTSASMQKAAAAFEETGYEVVNLGYPSRKFPIEELAPLAIEASLLECPSKSVIHFVTHSLGGILVRYYLEQEEISNLGRVVMLAPPNKGSKVVDAMRRLPGYKALNGPAGLQLGTGDDSVPLTLGAVDYEVGIVAGTRTVNLLLSQYLSNPDDGKVSVENTKVQGMTDFVVVPSSHPFIMKSSVVIDQAILFIRTGRFAHDRP
ncbi:MAG: alpha/beta hydrolase [Proteobacteria bacterium]|nr:alpha/beta hydrolase [Pseudomonadota bacterium]